MTETYKRKSKKLSYLLRHDKETLKCPSGFVSVEELNKQGFSIEILKSIVSSDSKKRYSFNEDYSKIRANQGHSVSSVNVELTPVKLQKDVYHGTSPDAIESILSQGLTPQYRNYVHMSSDIETAITVGKRHSKDEDPIILCISKEVPEVFISENNVLLTEYVDPKYINILKGQ